ncbi:hypothetical protein GCM10019059_38890 [Camelimonas fluminis]|uniref:KGG domain-containing protein n=1 Tax=Camelimonas fluminis TaxID=1576911 RepID=A0ABV7UKT8_9HYPH|nr:KGG domain-containing protein [Camelimonas fluminis]GHE75742.1 hypothetical protein GCM10019059_38890 [Camelimonas fluminis]
MENTKPKSRRGFASMDPARRKEIASKGGRSVPKEKRAFFTHTGLAATAGSKGGKSVGAGERAFSQDRTLASRAGKKSREKS